jgi:hypothetical protein
MTPRSVRKRHHDRATGSYHVAVGEHESIGCEDDAGAAVASNLDADDRRPDCLHGGDDGSRISIEETGIIIEIERRRESHAPAYALHRRRRITRSGWG